MNIVQDNQDFAPRPSPLELPARSVLGTRNGPDYFTESMPLRWAVKIWKPPIRPNASR